MTALSDQALAGRVIVVTGAAPRHRRGHRRGDARRRRVSRTSRPGTRPRPTKPRWGSTPRRSECSRSAPTSRKPESLADAVCPSRSPWAHRRLGQQCGHRTDDQRSQVTPDAWRREFDVNVGGVVNGAPAARLPSPAAAARSSISHPTPARSVFQYGRLQRIEGRRHQSNPFACP